jgi:Na+/H+ antiporter NhaD/arsenite permease-like protein
VRTKPILFVACLFLLTFVLLLIFSDRGAAAARPESNQTSTSIRANSFPGPKDSVTHHGPDIGKVLPAWSVLPFAGILLSIALFPLLAPRFWHHHYGKVSAFWALVFALPFVYAFHQAAVFEILHVYLIDYIPFIILLWALFTIAGGIVVRGSLNGTPAVNTVLLFLGTVLASWVGTTGAAMVMIRPVLRANRHRARKAHIICFFIFLVANIGGALTPLGDPPLFLGFLHQVPFFWVTMAILPHMVLASSILLGLFFLVDTFVCRKEQGRSVPPGKDEEKVPVRIDGLYNLIFLAGVVGLVLMSGYWKAGRFHIMGVAVAYENLVRDAGIVVMGCMSLYFTPWGLRQANDFGWAPIVEVAKLFAGIFMTIVPALAILQAGSEGALGSLLTFVRDPVHFFWAAGSLSSFLDNAPTYLTFFNMALGKLGMTESMVPLACSLGAASATPGFVGLLKGVSAGSVFMGANTYIGNAPNFMVKSIAEEAGVRMPSFFGYMLKYSIPILIPVFVLVSIVFFR